MDVRNRAPGWLFLVVAGGFALGAGGRRADAVLPTCTKNACNHLIGWYDEIETNPGKFIEKDAPDGCYANHFKGFTELDADWTKNGRSSAMLNVVTHGTAAGNALTDRDPNDMITVLVYGGRSWDCDKPANLPPRIRSATPSKPKRVAYDDNFRACILKSEGGS